MVGLFLWSGWETENYLNVYKHYVIGKLVYDVQALYNI